MSKDLPNWAYGVLATAGAVLVASMLFLWIDVGGWEVRGLSLAWNDNHWLLLVPVIGAALSLAAITRSSATRALAVLAGMAVAGYTLFDIATSLIHSDLATWLVLGGAGVLLASRAPSRTGLRVAGGAAVLAGFFAPWSDSSMFHVLWNADLSITDIVIRLLWLIPVAACAGILSGGTKTAGSLAALAGGAVYAIIAIVVLDSAWNLFGLGAWLALGASTVSLVVGAIAVARPVVVDDAATRSGPAPRG